MSKGVDIALLESYLAGDISADQVYDREGNILPSGALELAIAEYNDVVIQLEGAALKSRLIEMQAAMPAKSQKNSFKAWYAAAAAVLILLTAGLLWQNANRSPSFEEYFSHFDQLLSFRGDTGNLATDGMAAYSRKDYKEAFDLLAGLDSPELNDELKFYLGVSALGSEHVTEAISVFEGLGMERNNKYYQQTRWYLALAYWRNDQVNMALDLLQSIQNDQFKFKEAQLLRKGLN